jgi:hypothetical protein
MFCDHNRIKLKISDREKRRWPVLHDWRYPAGEKGIQHNLSEDHQTPRGENEHPLIQPSVLRDLG